MPSLGAAYVNIRGDLRGLKTDLDKALDQIKGLDSKVSVATSNMTKAFNTAAYAVKGLVAAMAAIQTGSFIKDATMAAARYEMLGIAMRVAGNTAGYTGAQMEKAAQGMQKMGISMIASRENAMKMVVAQLDLAKAAELARVAQDVARVANINSSEAFTRMIQGIRSGEKEIFKTMGLMIDMNKAYRDFEKANNIAKGKITETQRAQAVMNAVLVEGEKYAALYASTLGTVAGQVLSMERHIDNFKVVFGEAFGPAAQILVGDLTQKIKEMTELVGKPESQQALKDFAKGIAGIGGAALQTTGLVAGLISKLGWLLKQKEEMEKKLGYDDAGLQRAAERINYVTQGGKVFTGAINQATKGFEEYSQAVEKVIDTNTNLNTSIEVTADQLSKLDKRLKEYFETVDKFEGVNRDIRASWAVPMSEQLEGFKTAMDTTWDAINAEIEESTKLVEKEVPDAFKDAGKEAAKEWEHFLERVQDATADTLYDIFDGAIDGFDDLLDRMGDLFKRALAEWAAQALLKPIIVPIVQAATGIFGSAGGASGGSGTSLAMQGGSWLYQNYGQNTGIGNTIAGLSSFPLLTDSGSVLMQEGISLTGGAGWTPTSMVGSGSTYTLGNALGAYGLGSLGYSTIGDWVGLPQGGYSNVGAGLGAVGGSMLGTSLGTGGGILAGASYGSIVPVIGTIIGAVLGGVLGSLIGGDKPNKKYADIEYSTGFSPTFGWGDMPSLGTAEADQGMGWSDAKEGVTDATRQMITGVVSNTYDALETWFEGLPEELATAINEDLESLTINIGGIDFAIPYNRGAERVEEALQNLGLTLHDTIMGQVMPVIISNVSEYIGNEISDSTGILGMLRPNHAVNQLLNSGLFADPEAGNYGMAEGANFEEYLAGSGTVLTTLDQLQGAWDAVNLSLDRMITPLSQFQAGLEDVQNSIDSQIAVLKQLGFDEEALAEVRERGAEAIQAYKDRYATSIDDRLTNDINRMTLSSEDYAVWQAETNLAKDLEAIAELGPEYAYLADEAKELYRLQVEGIREATEAEKERQRINFTRAQMHWQGYDDTEIGMQEISNRYNWSSAQYGSTGNYDWEAIMADGVTRFLDMTKEEFDAFVEKWGLDGDQLIKDITFLSDTFNELDDVIKDSMLSWEDLSKSIRDQILKLQTGWTNPADIFERIDIQEAAINDMLGGQDIKTYLDSLGSDAERADAVQRLQGMYGDRLGLYQEAYQRPSLEYQGAFSGTIGDLNALAEYADLMKSEYQLQYEQVSLLQEIANNTSGLATIPQYADGGYTPGGLVFTHPDELILNPQQQSLMLNGGSNSPAGDSNTTVNITVNAYGGNSDEVANKAVAKMMQVLPAELERGRLRVSVQRASGRR